MNKYTVYYNKGQEDEINYGELEGKTEIDALEEIVKYDTVRKIYDRKKQPKLRYNGMTAIPSITGSGALEPADTESDTMDKINEANLNVQQINTSFDKLHREYDLLNKDLAKFKESAIFGATLHYNNIPPRFIPIFAMDKDYIVNGEYPYKYTINFNQELLAIWITELKVITKGQEDRD